MKQKHEIKLIIMIIISSVLTIISSIISFSFSFLPENNIQVPVDFASTSNSSATNISGSIRVRDFLQPFISASLDNSELCVLVNKAQVDQLNENSTYPFRWGVHLTSGFGDDKINDYIIELEICVDYTGDIIETKASSYIMIDSNNMELVGENISQVDASLNGTDYIISCDITNEYISTDDICIDTIFHY